MRYLKALALPFGVLLGWQILESGYILYLAAASQNLLGILGSECSLHLQGFRDILIFHPRFDTTRSVPIADVIAPAPFALAVLAFRRLSPWTWLAALCLLTGAHLLTVQGAVFAYTTTVFEAGEHPTFTAEMAHLFYLLFYQPLRFAQIPLAFLYIYSTRKDSP